MAGPNGSSPSSEKAKGRVAFVLDERLSRDKTAILNRSVHAMRGFAEVQLLPGSISEAELIKKLSDTPFQLVMAPWYRYLAWSKVEALYGLTRTSGPTFAGYFCEQLLPYELDEQADHLRAILLDFGNLSVKEITTVLKSLFEDSKRAGLLPLINPGTPAYAEHWYSAQGLGTRIDTILSLPELRSNEWHLRGNAIRIVMTALWSLIYEAGPGKSEAAQNIASKTPKASFQVTADTSSLLFKLCYILPSSSPKDVLGMFWPDPKKPTAGPQLLLKHADVLRVHHVAEGNLVEVVTGFVRSAPAEAAHNQVHTMWIEPLAPNLIREAPFELPGPTAPHLKALPEVPVVVTRASADDTVQANELRVKDKYIQEITETLRTVRLQLQQREARITEMKAGGIGTAPPLPPPDAESLLDAFQEKFFDARFQLRQFELQIAELEKSNGSQKDIDSLKKKMEQLNHRQAEWIKKLAKTIQSLKTKT